MKLRYFLCLAFLLPGAAAAQRSLTLAECRAMALESNKRVISSGLEREAAGYTEKSYRSNFLPKVSASGLAYFTDSKMDYTIELGSFQIFDADNLSGVLPPQYVEAIRPLSVIELPGYDLDFSLNRTYMAGVNIRQPIYTGGKIRSAYKMSSIGRDIAEMNFSLTENEVIIATDEAYWGHYRALEMEKVAIAYKEVVEELLRNIGISYETGITTRNDLYKVQVKFNEAELQVQKAANGVRLSRMNLCHMIGLPLTADISIAGTPESRSDSEVGLPDITSRPEYIMLTRQIDLRSQEINLTRSDFLPSVRITGGYSYLNGLRLNDSPLTNRASFSAMLSVNIPIFSWGEGRNKVRAAKTGHSMAMVQRDEAVERMELELAMAINQLEEASLELAMNERSVQQAEENLRISRDFYEVGMETLAGYLEAQTAWQQARSSLVEAQTSLRMTEVRYLKAGGLLHSAQPGNR